MNVSAAAGRRRRRDERREETRLLLLQSAALLFARRGYHGVSLDAVAEEAGFSKGAVYAHFSSKQDLLASLLERHCEQQLAAIRALLADPLPLEERIPQIGDAYFGTADGTENWCLLFVELWCQAMRESSLRPRLARLYDDTREAVAGMIERETVRLGGALAVPAAELAPAVIAVGDGLLMQHLIAPSDGSAKAYASALRALFGSALRPVQEEGFR
jgi:AcrR family transcriptional regulator